MEMVAGRDLQPDCSRIHPAGLSVCHPAIKNPDSRLPAKHGSLAEHGGHHHAGVCALLRLLRDIPAGALRKEEPVVGKLLWWYPSLLLFPVVFCCLTEAIFTFVGMSFTTIACIVAASVLVLIPVLAWAVKYFVPEKDLRLEIHFLVSLFVCILGLLTTVNGKTVYAAVDEPVNWNAVILALSLFAGLFIVGYVWSRIKYPLIQKRNKKKERNKITINQ